MATHVCLFPSVPTPLPTRAVQARFSIFTLFLAVIFALEACISLNAFACSLANLVNGTYVGYGECLWQSFYLTSMGSSISWVNMLVMVELYRMLAATKALRKYSPPSRLMALSRCLIVCLICIVVMSIIFFPAVPFKPRLVRGLLCIPMSDGTPYGMSTILLLILPLSLGLPTCITIGLGIMCWRRKLLHFELEKQRRTIRGGLRSSQAIHEQASHRERVQAAKSVTIFFLQAFLCQLMWYPALFALIIDSRSVAPFTLGVALIPLQSFASSILAMSKSDVRASAMQLLRRCCFFCLPPSSLTMQVAPQNVALDPNPRTQLAVFSRS
mgnify:CR=1 FL=1